MDTQTSTDLRNLSYKGKLSTLYRVFRSRGSQSATTLSKSHERYVRVALTTGAAALNKVISIGASVITVRLTFQYLGAERYGMWTTITSTILLLGFADFGMSNGLVNMVGDALGRKDNRAAQSAVASAFWMLATVALVGALAMAASFPFIDTSRLFNVHSTLAVKESGPTLVILFLCFAVALPLGAVRGTLTGIQSAFVNNVWNSIGSLASLMALLIAIHFHAGLPLLALALSGPPLLANMLNGAELFLFSRPELRPNPRFISLASTSRMFRTGMAFFLLQIAVIVGMQTDNIVIAQIMGAQAVPEYAVPQRMFAFVLSLLVMASGSVWPAYVDALAQSDGRWIYRTFLRVAAGGTLITVLLTSVLVILGNRILSFWVGPQMHASLALLGTLGLLCFFNAFLQPMAFLLTGLGIFRFQVINFLVMAVVNLGLSILFVKRYGVLGAALGTVIAILVVQIVPYAIVTVRTLRRLRHQTGNRAPVGPTREVGPVEPGTV
jgi:O-antigen/teichoic acid export membrane protein